MIEKYKYSFGIFFVTLICAFVYYPGLSGGLILDDTSNLSLLHSISGKISFDSLREYIGLSQSGTLKRPISMLSFLIDANNWPTDLWSFKRTNLFIHLFNGLLLFTLYYKIFQNHNKLGPDAFFIALLGMTLWILHPFLVSSVLYIVQRMSLLAATFVLLGLLVYTIGRGQYEKTNGKKGRFYMLIGVYFMPVFAVLSKENGILLVYFIIIFEVLIFRNFLHYKELAKKDKFFIYLPSIISTIALISKMPSFIHYYNVREFTLYERLLTEFRVITTYLYHIFMPEYFTEGAYSDGYKLSYGFFNPLTTFVSVIFVIALIFYAWVVRVKKPLISFAIIFFFVGHLLESTIIPLELYYEHRNYIPMLFVFVPLVLGLNQLRKKYKVVYIFIFCLVTGLTLLTFLRTNLWGDNYNLHLKTVDKYPESTRAVTMLAIIYGNKHEPINSYKTLKQAMEVNNSMEIKINYLKVLCLGKLLMQEHIVALYNSSKVDVMTRTSLPPYESFFSEILNDQCGIGKPIENANILLNILKDYSFESNTERKPITYFFKAKIDFKLGNYSQAKHWFVRFFQWQHDYSSLFLFTKDLYDSNQLEMGRDVLAVGYQIYQEDYKYAFDWLQYDQQFQQLQEITKLKD